MRPERYEYGECEVCGFWGPGIRSLSVLGVFPVNRCVHCHALEAESLKEAEKLIDLAYVYKHEPWFKEALTFVRSTRSGGGIYTKIGDLLC